MPTKDNFRKGIPSFLLFFHHEAATNNQFLVVFSKFSLILSRFSSSWTQMLSAIYFIYRLLHVLSIQFNFHQAFLVFLLFCIPFYSHFNLLAYKCLNRWRHNPKSVKPLNVNFHINFPFSSHFHLSLSRYLSKLSWLNAFLRNVESIKWAIAYQWWHELDQTEAFQGIERDF